MTNDQMCQRTPIIAFLIALIIAGCNSPTDMTTDSPTPSATVRATPTPTPTTTPVPTATPIPNRQTVAFVSDYEGNDEIYLLDLDDGTIVNLTQNPADDKAPAWSPDGRRLAFQSHRDGNWELYLLDMVSGAVTRLTDHLAYDGRPAWSPDGTAIAFESYRDGNLELYLLDLTADSAPLRLTNEKAGDYAPAWSPDGSTLAFTTWRDGNKEIYTLDLATGALHNLTQHPADDEFPAWSPDGTAIAFVSWRDGNAELYTMHPDGSEQQRITTSDVYDGAPAWSPDGQTLIAEKYVRGEPFEVYDPYRPGEVYLFATNPAGERARQLTAATFGQRQPTVAHAIWPAAPLPAPTPTPLPSPEPGSLLGLRELPVSAPGYALLPYLNERVADSYEAWRAEVTEKTGYDFLGLVSDMFRRYGPARRTYGYLSWHRAGRAVDLRFDLIDENGENRLIRVREDIGQQIHWRLFIKCAAQDGTQGEPMTVGEWRFWWNVDRSLEPEIYEQGGEPLLPPEGYFVDLTAIAHKYGWERIAAYDEEDYSWKFDTLGTEYWHYQRTDGLTWYAAMQEIYSEETLREDYAWEKCQALGIGEDVLRAKGIPTPAP
ncbi:MAG: DPP IV N-terminal domain-containing protein [Anaerolineae bacterium]|nr:DPP IV N-terminal domain-containing protein [Anaerolineae bacterium]MDH7473652.1 DPP IV N-terminal domain-containing protein [Anaerolineae bacterium]